MEERDRTLVGGRQTPAATDRACGRLDWTGRRRRPLRETHLVGATPGLAVNIVFLGPLSVLLAGLAVFVLPPLGEREITQRADVLRARVPRCLGQERAVGVVGWCGGANRDADGDCDRNASADADANGEGRIWQLS